MAGLLAKFSPNQINEASLDALGYPAAMITSYPEVSTVHQYLENQ
ncbi:MAG: hypothetical protein U0930_05020 [Pirellulales bacterium]